MNTLTKGRNHIRSMTECSIMISLATVLSILKLIDMPYGGSVTIASMLPIAVISYRHGFLWGIGSALVHGSIQLLLGLNVLSYFTSWYSIVAIIMLDYLVAFGVFSLSGLFKKIEKRQNYALLYGILFCSILRYACHVISGATLWAGLSIPTEAALLYSLSYNATYMIPETIVLSAVALYIASAMDFNSETVSRVRNKAVDKGEIYLTLSSGLVFTLTVIADVKLLFPFLQNAETGEFVFTGIRDANLLLIAIISAVGVFAAAALYIAARFRRKKTLLLNAKLNNNNL